MKNSPTAFGSSLPKPFLIQGYFTDTLCSAYHDVEENIGFFKFFGLWPIIVDLIETELFCVFLFEIQPLLSIKRSFGYFSHLHPNLSFVRLLAELSFLVLDNITQMFISLD